MHATLATLVMYYAERFEAEEMHSVLTKSATPTGRLPRRTTTRT